MCDTNNFPRQSQKELSAKPIITQLNLVAVAFETVCLASYSLRFDYHFLLGYDERNSQNFRSFQSKQFTNRFTKPSVNF